MFRLSIAWLCGVLYSQWCNTATNMKEPIMANNEKPATVENDDIEIDFININESAPSNKYEAHVLKLIAADEKRTKDQVDDGIHASVRLTFPKTENGKPAIERYKRWFRESAAAHNVSAKVAGEWDKGDAIEFRYVVVPKIVRPRKDKSVVGAPADESDVPTAVDTNDDPKTPLAETAAA